MSNVSSDLAVAPPWQGHGRRRWTYSPGWTEHLRSRTPGEQRGSRCSGAFVKGSKPFARSDDGLLSTGVHEQVLSSLEVTFGKYTFSNWFGMIERHAVRQASCERTGRGRRIAPEVSVEPFMAEPLPSHVLGRGRAQNSSREARIPTGPRSSMLSNAYAPTRRGGPADDVDPGAVPVSRRYFGRRSARRHPRAHPLSPVGRHRLWTGGGAPALVRPGRGRNGRG